MQIYTMMKSIAAHILFLKNTSRNQGGNNMIDIIDLTKKFGSFTAVDNLSLHIDNGEFVGLLGPNGAGKTTTIKILTGLLKATNGEVFISGEPMNSNNKNAKSKMGIVPQYSNLDKELTVYENLVFASKLFRVKNYDEKIHELLDLVDLTEYADRKVLSLSGGMDRRLIIAKALINDPEIIIFDEPTVGIDLNGRRKIWDILKYMKSVGKTVIMTTHYIEEAEYLCSRVCLIDSGKIIVDDTAKNLKEKLGSYILEYFDENMLTRYVFFQTRAQALEHAKTIENYSYTVRETTLEDVFFNYTNRKVT
ncbi:MAG TPA: hypothetical protein DEF04_11030 [Clostridiales bacterium]|nr:hypothetical protein [Clostridiales bacterium]